ncbi:DUF3068 domain-containing protein [Smaragdicoccus niigatensis]|uniref:DUF3068 domain-containing protein n=1 Tax=Smaragdicoccus niigatensis TaxID=359359 RepID=UPI0003A25215|nr:DUF3068 domain-containing protein [Smaragdicoccus niigatensis]
MPRGRLVTLILFGLGAFFLVAAVLLPTFTYSQLAKTPLDLEATTVATTDDDGAELVDPRTTSGSATLGTSKKVPLVMQRFITVEDPADSSVATLQCGQTMRRTDRQGDTGLLSALVDRVTIDRTTGDPTDPVGSLQDNGLKPPTELKHTGLQYRFPIGTEKKAYQYFDLTARKSFELQFVEETDLAGTTVYHFHQKINPVDLTTVDKSNSATFSADKWGIDGGSTKVTLPMWYSNERDLWVEPRTGTIVKAEEKINNFYARSASKPVLTVLKANLTFDESTVETLLSTANDFSDRLSLYSRILPVLLALGGIAALVVAGLRVRNGDGGGDDEAVAPFDDEPEWSTRVSASEATQTTQLPTETPWSTNPFNRPTGQFPPPPPPAR